MALPDQPLSTTTPPEAPTDLPSDIAELLKRGGQRSARSERRVTAHYQYGHGWVTWALLFVLLLASLSGLFVGLRLISGSEVATTTCLLPARPNVSYARIVFALDPCTRELGNDRLPQRS